MSKSYDDTKEKNTSDNFQWLFCKFYVKIVAYFGLCV